MKRPTSRNVRRLVTGMLVGLLLCSSVFAVGCDPADFLAEPGPEVTNTQAATAETAHISPHLDEIINLIETRQIDALYALFTPEDRERYRLEDLEFRRDTIDRKLALRSYHLRDIEKIERASNEDVEIYEMHAVMETAFGTIDRPLTLAFSFDRHKNKWQLNYTASIIFPGLTDENDLIVEELTAPRGTIYDRNGEPLALDTKGQVVGAISGAYDLSDNAEVADLLGMTKEKVDAIMSQEWIGDNMYVPLKSQISFTPDQLSKLDDYHLEMRLQDMRYYPFGAATAHLIGHIGEITQDELEADVNDFYQAGDLVGKRGLESLFESDLRATPGVRVYLSGTKRQLLYERQPVPGKDFHLTVDAAFQAKLYELFKEDEGQVVCMDPMKGDLLVLMSVPSFDPNDFVQGISGATYQSLLDDNRLPLWNKFQPGYAPGSTMKLLTAIAALRTGTIGMNDTKTIVGKTWRPDASWGAYHISRVVVDDSPQTLADALVISDNIFFSQLALEMGAETFVAEMDALGFGEEIPCAYPFPAGVITSRGYFEGPGVLAASSFGQGEVQITSTQLASVYSAVATDGNMPAPRLLADRDPVTWKEQAVPADAIDYLRGALKRTVGETHSYTAYRDYADLAGKSGTVETVWDQELDTMSLDSWFVGFDLNDPTLVVCVQEQNVHRSDDRPSGARRFGQVFDLLRGKPVQGLNEEKPEEHTD